VDKNSQQAVELVQKGELCSNAKEDERRNAGDA
jgi:hypothetical protein